MSIMDNILTYLIIAFISIAIGFVVAWGIVVSWVLFWEFGYIWNTITVPPLVAWNIFFVSLPSILILGGIIAIILFGILCIYVAFN